MRASINDDSVTLNAILQNTVKRVQLIKERQYCSVYSFVNTHVGKYSQWRRQDLLRGGTKLEIVMEQ